MGGSQDGARGMERQPREGDQLLLLWTQRGRLFPQRLFDLICRSHQAVEEEGYEFAFERRLVTISSVPNYCSEFLNLAAVLKVGSDLLCRLEQFEGQPISVKKRQRSVTPLRMS